MFTNGFPQMFFLVFLEMQGIGQIHQQGPFP